MDRILTGTVFGGHARVAVITLTDAVNEEIKLHDLSPLSAAAFGRTMAAGAYLGANLKNKEDVFSISVKGSGCIGGVVVAGNGDGTLRGYVANPHAELPLKANGHLDVGQGIGLGTITVCKDLGLKEPYNGTCELVTGEIAEDFAEYLVKSEGISSAVALGVLNDKNGCRAAGGVIVEAMPGITEDMLVILEDVMSNFGAVSTVLSEKTPEEIFDFYFAHLDAEVFPAKELKIKCSCGREKIENALISIGKEECENIVKEHGKIEVSCHFCEKRYVFTQDDVERIWGK
ncbi:MAG: Hsp33 family molecular chaperone HslO [Clostridia bacterium]|nr:Hsp33 family molecular chaperone HslO [Clostridia bacterium]